jgi:hypothetical protein
MSTGVDVFDTTIQKTPAPVLAQAAHMLPLNF